MGSDKLFQKKKFRTAKALARQKSQRAPYEIIRIICEGKTECVYFNNFIKYLKLNTVNVIALPGKGSAPKSIVEHGIEIAKNEHDIDYIYCVFDYDRHLSYQEALYKLQNHKPKHHDKSKPTFKSITSSPCFEIWPLLHFSCTTKAYNPTGNKSAADNLITDLQSHLPFYKKNTVEWCNALIHKTNAAIQNAKKLQKYNNATGSINPATNIHELIGHLMKLNG